MLDSWPTWVPILISGATFVLYVRGVMRELMRERNKELRDRLEEIEEECRELRRTNERLLRVIAGLRNGNDKG